MKSADTQEAVITAVDTVELILRQVFYPCLLRSELYSVFIELCFPLSQGSFFIAFKGSVKGDKHL